jgi:anti-sigma regulatory factor (Ser/Thr protein kinase)
MATGQIAGGAFRHEAVLYRQPAEYQSAVLGFVRDGVARAEPVLVAVPGAAAGAIRSGLDGQAKDVAFTDMTQLGRNPGRIMSAIWDFVDKHDGQRVRFVGEPVWPGRSAAEIREAVTHEAMINLAFAAVPISVMCPYDAGRLAPAVMAGAARTHPVISTAGGTRPSSDYAADEQVRDAVAQPLPRPPGAAQRLAYTTDLRSIRGAVGAYAERAGLRGDRLADLVIAVSEVAANTLRHTPAGGSVCLWRAGEEVICEVGDRGWIADPLAGRRRPLGPGGLGLWVVNQVCDLVELRTGQQGTTVRMHMRLALPEAACG